MTEATPPVAAQCPACGYETLHLITDRMVCGTATCGYEHLLTQAIPIIKPPSQQP